MKTNLILAALVGALTFLSAGCKSPQPGPYPPQNPTGLDIENREKFVLMDPGARQSITCTGLQETTLPDGRLQVAANVRNLENRRLEVQINCSFKDPQGFVLDETPYQTLILTEDGTETVSFKSLNDKARHYTVHVREAR
jgi:Protein of unknown function (DUF1425)